MFPLVGRFLTITAQLPSTTLICSMSIIVIESRHTESLAVASDYMYVAYMEDVPHAICSLRTAWLNRVRELTSLKNHVCREV